MVKETSWSWALCAVEINDVEDQATSHSEAFVKCLWVILSISPKELIWLNEVQHFKEED